MTAQISTTNLDWLAYTWRAALDQRDKVAGYPRLHCPAGWQLVECRSGTPQYAARHYLLDSHGQKCATLLSRPYSKILDHRDIYVEVANPLLYHGTYLDLHALLPQVHEGACCGLSRVDVARDYQPTEEQAATIARLHHGSAYVVGKRSAVHWAEYARGASGVDSTPYQLSYGSKTSDLRWKVYNKSKEITSTDDHGRTWCNKPYIAAAWDSAGLDPSRSTWRVEASLTSASTHDWRGQRVGWWLIDSGQWREWYDHLVRSRFRVRANEGHRCGSNDTLLDLLPLDSDSDLERLRQHVSDQPQPHVDYGATMRAAIRELERPEIAYNAAMRGAWLECLYATLEAGHLHGYFERTMGEPLETWAAKVATPAAPLA